MLKGDKKNTTSLKSLEADKLFFQFLLISCVFSHLILGLQHVSFHIHQLFFFLPARGPVRNKSMLSENNIKRFELQSFENNYPN